MKTKQVVRIFVISGLVLMVPLVAMQFSDEWDWNLPDFIVIGALLVGTGFAYEILAKKVKSSNQRLAIGLILLTIMLLIWAQLAVGIFDGPLAGS